MGCEEYPNNWSRSTSMYPDSTASRQLHVHEAKSLEGLPYVLNRVAFTLLSIDGVYVTNMPQV